MNKKIIIALMLILAVTGIWLFLRFLCGDEDTWICENGQWIQHGNPSAEKPTEPCLEEEIEQVPNTPSVLLEVSAPYSRATIYINEDGVVDYEGQNMLEENKDIATNSITIAQEDYVKLVSLINDSGFYELDGEYMDKNILDGTTYSITVTTEEEIEIVRCYGSCPEAFTNIRERIMELYGDEVINIGV